MMKLTKSNCDDTQKHKLWWNSKTQVMMKLKNSNCDKTQKQKLSQNSKTQMATKLKNENCRMATFDSLKEASWRTDCNAKNQNSFRWTIFEEKKTWPLKKSKKYGNCFLVFPGFFFKADHVYRFFECFY